MYNSTIATSNQEKISPIAKGEGDKASTIQTHNMVSQKVI